jgi:iron complex transport system ATP-binding protein
MIRLHDLGVSYRQTLALAPLTYSFERGSWACCIGPNGAGKSSALAAIAGLVAYEGRIEIGGQLAGSLSRRELSRLVAFVPQQPTLPTDMTVREFALLGRTPYIATFGTESHDDYAVVEEVLDELDLADFARRTLSQLSGGERQRVVLARALAQQAPVLLLDEPTSALDIGHTQQVLELVDHLRRTKGLTVLAAMHDLTLAAQYADTMLLLQHGKLTAAGSPAAVITESALRDHYGATVRVINDECGGVIVVPLRPHGGNNE